MVGQCLRFISLNALCYQLLQNDDAGDTARRRHGRVTPLSRLPRFTNGVERRNSPPTRPRKFPASARQKEAQDSRDRDQVPKPDARTGILRSLVHEEIRRLKAGPFNNSL